jgi:hypothetical protein
MIILLAVACLQAEGESPLAALLSTLEKAQVTFYNLDPASQGAVPPGRKRLHLWAVLQTKALSDPEASAVRTTLADKELHANTGAKCFEPGLAFRFQLEARTVDFVICLKCRWIYVFEGDKQNLTLAISPAGVAALTKLYQQHVNTEAKK